jgi:ABC-type oligopeptide transport system substrate-binding subunit
LGEEKDPSSIGVKALDDLTLELVLEDQTGYVMNLLATGFPVPRHVVEKYGEAWTESDCLVTNGPFRLEKWDSGEVILLSRNPEYPGRFPGNVERVELCLLDRSTKLKLYENGELDLYWISQSSPEEDRARQRFPEDFISAPGTMTSYVGFNTDRKPFDDRKVRQAFALATDKVTLADELMRGFEFPALGGFVPPGMPGHTKEIGPSFDPERARGLLKEADYLSGEDFPIIEYFYGGGCLRAPNLCAQWEEYLGVEIQCKSLDWPQLLNLLDTDPPHIYSMAWAADYPDPDNFLRTAHFQELTGWQHDEYQELVEGARRSGNQEERIKMYHEAERILVEEVPIVPLTYPRLQVLVKPWVKNFRVAGALRAWYKEIILEPH